MISNVIVSNQKVVLIVDDVGMERFSQRFVEKWLDEQGQSCCIFDENNIKLEKLDELLEFKETTNKNNVILPPLSTLLLNLNAAGVFQLVNQLKKMPTIKQLYLWATTKNISEHFVVPFLEYMADSIIHFIDKKQLSVITRKIGGLVSKKIFTYEMRENSFIITSTKKIEVKQEEPVVKPESLGTFKIDLNEEELIARNALKLPYERNSESSVEGQIIYTPDADDDIDDEDPDEDLYI